MSKYDILRIVRENDEKFKKHLEKIKELEAKEKELSYMNIYKSLSNNSNKTQSPNNLTTIPEEKSNLHCKMETPNSDHEENTMQENLTYKAQYDDMRKKPTSNYIYNEVYHSVDNENEDNINIRSTDNNQKDDENSEIQKEKISKEQHYHHSEEEEKNENLYSDDNNSEPGKYRSDQENENESNDKRNINDDDEEESDRIASEELNDKRNDKDAIPSEEEDEESDDLMDKKLKKMNVQDNSDSDSSKFDSHKIQRLNKAITPKFKSISNRCGEVKGICHSKINQTKKDLNIHPVRTNIATEKEKRPYTAYTYSSIKKMKPGNPPESKGSSFFESRVLGQKKYNGKADKVALYQLHKSYWEKKPYLSNFGINTSMKKKFNEEGSSPIDSNERNKMAKIKYIRKPLKFYNKI